MLDGELLVAQMWSTTGSDVAAKGRRLLLFTMGSRGDVQPIVALAGALQSSGYAVRLMTNLNNVPMAEKFGVSAVGVHFDVEALIEHEPLMQQAIEKGDMYKFMQFLQKRGAEDFPSVLDKQLEEVRTFRPDALLATFVEAAQARAIGLAFKIPVVHIWLSTAFPSGEVPVFGLPSYLPRCLHLSAWFAFNFILFYVDRSTKYKALEERIPGCLKFLPQSFSQFMLDKMHPIEPQVVGVSRHLMKSRPTDWPAELQPIFTGCWVVGAAEQERLMKAGDLNFGGESRDRLERFLAAGEKPVYIGWGSMVTGKPERMTCFAVRGLMLAKKRGIVLGGWAGLCPERLVGEAGAEELQAYAAEHVLFVKTAPHEWLFPRCAAVVHPGGAGTTAAALRSGVPSIVIPCAFDQFTNATDTEASGAGIGLRQFSKVKESDLAAAITRATSDSSMIARAAELGKLLKAEDGAAAATAALDSFFANDLEKWSMRAEERCRDLETLRNKEAKPCASFVACWVWVGRLMWRRRPLDFQVI